MASKLFDWLPPSPHAAMRNAIINLYRTDPTFGNVVDLDRSFRAWDGDRRDWGYPSSRETPWVRLTFKGAPGGWRAAGQAGVRDHSMPIILDVDLCVSGSDADDLSALWWVTSDVILPRADDAKVLEICRRLDPFGLMGIECIKAGWGIESKDDQGQCLFGLGHFRIDMVVNT